MEDYPNKKKSMSMAQKKAQCIYNGKCGITKSPKKVIGGNFK